MPFALRPAILEDKAFARRVHHAGYRDVVVRQFGEWDPVMQDAYFEQFWSSGSIEIIQVDGQAVGYCCIEHRSDDIHVRELVISPEFQGAGTGTAILNRVQSHARERRVPVRLGAFRANRAAQLYERCGFAQFDETPTHRLFEWRPQQD